jgi:hypothetical protein
MIEAGVSGAGATGIDRHLPRDGWHTQAAPATPTALAETAVDQDGHPIFVAPIRADVYLAPWSHLPDIVPGKDGLKRRCTP